MTTASTTPTYCVPNKIARVAWTLTGTGANYVRVWCTAAPSDSDLGRRLAEGTTVTRFQVYEGDGGDAQPWMWEPDASGKYSFACQEYTRGNSYGGGYEGCTVGGASPSVSETKVGSEATLYIYIGQRMTQKIGVGADTADLVVWVWNDTIRATTLATHGEKTPAIVGENMSRTARTAAESSAVTTLVDALDGDVAATAVGSLATVVAFIGGYFNDHIARDDIHAAADPLNSISGEFLTGPSPATLADYANEQSRRLRLHMLNDSGSGVGTCALHVVGASSRADFLNLPIVTSVGSVADAYPALADLHRSYDAHRQSTVVHTSADTVNVPPALPSVLKVHSAFLSQIVSASPTVPDTGQTGVVALAQHGFSEG